MKQIIENVLEELESTAGQVGQQAKQMAKGVVSDAGKQISGAAGSDQAQDSEAMKWEQVVGKPTDPQQMQKMQNDEAIKKQKNLNAIRQNLQAALEPPPSQQQEPPKYIKAKIEKQKEMQKLQEEEKKKPKDWAVQSAKLMGSGETRGGRGVGG